MSVNFDQYFGDAPEKDSMFAKKNLPGAVQRCANIGLSKCCTMSIFLQKLLRYSRERALQIVSFFRMVPLICVSNCTEYSHWPTWEPAPGARRWRQRRAGRWSCGPATRRRPCPPPSRRPPPPRGKRPLPPADRHHPRKGVPLPMFFF